MTNASTALQPLTLAAARSLKGKRIRTTYNGYRGQDGTDEFVVGDIVSEYELAQRYPIEGHANQAAYWESYMSPEKIQEQKGTLQILRADSSETFIRLHPENKDTEQFTCSDSDRFVQYESAD